VAWEELSEGQLKEECRRLAEQDYSTLGRWENKEVVGLNQANDPPGDVNE